MAQFVRSCAGRCGRKDGESILVALSGGADSTALLLLAAALVRREKQATPIAAVHVHHHLRAEADAEVDHCQRLCERLDIPLEVIHVHPSHTKQGIAAEARDLRHAALHAVALARGLKWILLAHHSDDLLETLLMRIGRGTGQRGLGGIPWRRLARRGDRRVVLGRPLLCATRAGTEEFCKSCGVDWCTDASNSQTTYARGFLRAHVTPQLARRWPNFALHAVGAAEAARAGNWALREIARRDGWTAAEVPRELFMRHGPVVSLGIYAAAVALGPLAPSHATLKSAVNAACDTTKRPRQYRDGAVVVEVTSKLVRIRASQQVQCLEKAPSVRRGTH